VRSVIRAMVGRLRRAVETRIRRMRAWPQLRQWQSTPDLAFTVTHPSHLLTWIVAALNRLGPDRVVFMDVGAARGDVLDAFTRDAGLVPPVYSVGIDPVDVRAADDYSRFIRAAVSTAAEGPVPFFLQESSDCSSLKRIIPSRVVYDRSLVDGTRYYAGLPIHRTLETLVVSSTRLSTIIQQCDLADEVVHFLKIDAQGADLDVFLSLDTFTRRCLFVQMETVYSDTPNDQERCLYEGQTTFVEDRAALEAAGFRLLAVYPFVVTPEADVLFVNMPLFEQLFTCTKITSA
jgi:hypothetical protein